MMQTAIVEGIISDFPTSVLTIIVGNTAQEQQTEIHKNIYSNCSSVHSNMVRDYYVHLALVISNYDYQY